MNVQLLRCISVSPLRADDLIFTFSGKHAIPCLRRENITDKEPCFTGAVCSFFFFLGVYWFPDRTVWCHYLRPLILLPGAGSRFEVAMTKAVTMEIC